MSKKGHHAPTTEKEDDLANLIGQFGKWQLLMAGSISLIKLSTGWVQLSILFLTPGYKFWCQEFADNVTTVAENSTCYDNCISYAYDTSPFENTIVSEWDLVCDRAWLASFTQMALQFGLLVGSFFFGYVSDRYGRKNSFLITITVLIALGFGVPFAPDYTTFTIIRFFMGVAVAGAMMISFVVVVETVGKDYREIMGCVAHLPFNVAHISLPLFAYYFRSWDEYSLALAIPPLIFLAYFVVLYESPRWLVTVGRLDEATKVVNKAARMNGLPTAKVEETLKKMSDEIRSKSTEKKPTLLLFSKLLTLKTFCCWYIWIISGLTFYGLNQYISQASEDPFIAVAAAGVIEIPANVISIWLIRSLGRKRTVSAFFILEGIFVLILGVIPDIFWMKTTLGTLGVFAATVVANCLYIYTTELFPTVVRNMGLGFCSTWMRVGSMAAPFVSNFSLTFPWLRTVLFGLAPITSGLVSLVLPETKGTTLRDSVEEVLNAE